MSAQPVLMPASLLVVVPTLNSHALLLFIDGPSGPEHRRWLDQCCAAEPRCSAPPPPHQPTLFGPGYRIYLKKHSQDHDIRLAKDLARNL